MIYFTIKELTQSAKARELFLDNAPNQWQIDNLIALVDNVLDSVRFLAGEPVKVNSGFRSVLLNKAIHGANNSQHCKGEAADITLGSKEKNIRLFNEILKIGITFDQMILENGGEWIHISYRKGKNRMHSLKK